MLQILQKIANYLPDNSHKQIVRTDNQEFSNLSVNQLILKISRAIPTANHSDCTEFQALLNELKTRPNLEMMFFAGEYFDNKKLPEGIKIHHQFGKKYKKSRLNRWLKFKIYRYLHINQRTEIVLPFLHLCLENIKQHVNNGFAIVILETLKNRCIKLAIIDNGTGFLNRHNEPISIKQAILYNHTFGENGHKGQALWWMVQNKSPVTFIKQGGEAALLIPNVSSSTPSVKRAWQLDDTYGTTVIALFNYNNSMFKLVNKNIIKY